MRDRGGEVKAKLAPLKERELRAEPGGVQSCPQGVTDQIVLM
jgi:hypothetical protein